METNNRVIAQNLETITYRQNIFKKNPQIMVGSQPVGIAINEITNKIYIANQRSGTVSVIDSNSGGPAKDIRVGGAPSFIAVDSSHNKIYVANKDSNTVSVIDGYNDSKIGDVAVGNDPRSIAISESTGKIYIPTGNDIVSVINGSNDRKIADIAGVESFRSRSIAIDSSHDNDKIYIPNFLNGTVSVINGSNDRKEADIPVGKRPYDIAVDILRNKIYVANNGNDTVSVINGSNDRKGEPDIPVGRYPTYIADEFLLNKIYVSTDNDTVSVINGSNDMKEADIPVGKNPFHMAISHATSMIYVVNQGSRDDYGSVSVIDGFSNRVAAGVKFNIYPANSGKIICNTKEYPTNTYLFVDTGTKCTAQSNRDFGFTSWAENLNRNSSIPLSDASSTLTVNRYGTFSANFEPLPPAIPPDILLLLFGIILSSLIGWSIPSIMGWVKTRTQRKYLKKCINQIGKLDRNAIEEMITEYYVDGKISEPHRQLLKDKISEYYEKVKG
jgi:YVTN family beta-propeller protein